MVKGLPDLYNQFAAFVDAKNPFQAARDERSWRRDHEEHQGIVGPPISPVRRVSTTMGVLGQILNLTTALSWWRFYISIAGPKLAPERVPSGSLRDLSAASSWCGPWCRIRFPGSCFSRSILAAINAACIVGVPDDHQGAVLAASGFVLRHCLAVRPRLFGTYIGGALPVLFAWG